ncbi:MAG: DUF2232 domain-containing protein [Thermodesulfobacteriota bacterium]
MTDTPGKPEGRQIIQAILLVAGVILLPSLLTVVFGWMHGLLPLLVFYYRMRYGRRTGTRYILHGGLISVVAGALGGILGMVMFSLTLIPAGLALADSADRGENVSRAGLKGVMATLLIWFGLGLVIQITSGTHPYFTLVNMLDQGMSEAIKYYQESSSIPADSLFLLEQTIAQMRMIIPRLLPAILGTMILSSVWLAMVFGNRLLLKNTGSCPWPPFRQWQLPDNLIWLMVVGFLLSVLAGESGKTIGYNVVIVTGVIYCFQGVAVLIFLFDKWKVPPLLRLVLYIVLIFQSFGAILLSLLGVVDVWFDLRRLNQDNEEE